MVLRIFCGILFVTLAAVPVVFGKPVNESVMYGVVPTIFGAKPLPSVTSRLDDLKDLGIDAIWLAPINATDDPSAISYAVTDYFSIRADFGNEEDLKDLIKEAHKRDIKVLMDFVPNHSSAEHPFFKDALSKGKSSPYFNYYERNKEGEPTYYFDWEHLPNLNYGHPAVYSMMLEAFSYWIKKFDIDGFRVDVAWGIKERRPNFWPELRSKLTKLKPEVILLAEASARDAYYTQNGFDLAYDWTDKLGIWAWQSAFKNPSKASTHLHRAFSVPSSQLNKTARYLNNNDTGKRFISRHGLPTTKLAALLQFTTPGVPVVYSGDEIGAEYEPYEDPAPIDWSDRLGLRSYYKKLIQLKTENSALHSGNWEPSPPVNTASAYAYFRKSSANQRALTILNFGKTQKIKIKIPAAHMPALTQASLIDSVTGARQKAKVDGDLITIDLKAKTGVVFLY